MRSEVDSVNTFDMMRVTLQERPTEIDIKRNYNCFFHKKQGNRRYKYTVLGDFETCVYSENIVKLMSLKCWNFLR